jgi:hypothetical protein
MNTKDFPLNNCTERQHVEQLIKHFPNLYCRLSSALLIKTKKAIYTCHLMIPSKKKEILRKLEFVRKEKHDALQGHRASIDVVPEEKVTGISRRP